MRRYLMRKANRAFTLIELMIVVAIIGILAVLAIYGVRKYLANAKTAEARNSLGQIAKDAATEYERESMAGTVLPAGQTALMSRALCASATKGVPPSGKPPAGAKYQSLATDWTANGADAITNVGFSCLKFTMDAPQYYYYNYTAKGASAIGDTFTATANGDLNGDTVVSTFTLIGAIQAGYVLAIAPNITELSPEE
jgi:type IV pilus assembly protein PilA